MAKYLVNKLISNVSLIDDRIQIKPLASVQVAESELEHGDVIDALRRNWVEISDQLVATGEVPNAKIEFERSPLEGSLTPPGVETKAEPVKEEESVQEPAKEPAKRGRKAAE